MSDTRESLAHEFHNVRMLETGRDGLDNAGWAWYADRHRDHPTGYPSITTAYAQADLALSLVAAPPVPEGVITFDEALRRKVENRVLPALMGNMMKIEKLIEWASDIRKRFGNTCVYVNDLSWGAVALNRSHDDAERLGCKIAWDDVPAPDDAAVQDAARLEWVLRHTSGTELRRTVGFLSDTSNLNEYRAAIDAARSAKTMLGATPENGSYRELGT